MHATVAGYMWIKVLWLIYPERPSVISYGDKCCPTCFVYLIYFFLLFRPPRCLLAPKCPHPPKVEMSNCWLARIMQLLFWGGTVSSSVSALFSPQMPLKGIHHPEFGLHRCLSSKCPEHPKLINTATQIKFRIEPFLYQTMHADSHSLLHLIEQTAARLHFATTSIQTL